MLTRLVLGAAILFGLAASALAQPTTVTASVNMRAGPGTQFAVVAVLPQGSVVTVGACAAGWCEVTHGNRRGYVSHTYLVATPPPPPTVPPYLGVLLSPPHSISFRDAWSRAPRVPGAGCFVNGALWAIGWPATGRVVERARQGAAARAAHVARHGFNEKRSFVSHRLTLAVDQRNVIWGVSCG